MEPEPGEGLSVAVEELGRLAAHDAIEGRHSLLPVQQQLHHTCRQRPVAAMRRRLRFGGPDEQATHRMAAVERVEEPAHLVAIPDVPSLELGQRHVPAVDMVEDRGDLHTRRVLPVSSSCIIACLRAWVLSRRASRAVSLGVHIVKSDAIAACSSTPGRGHLDSGECARLMRQTFVPAASRRSWPANPGLNCRLCLEARPRRMRLSNLAAMCEGRPRLECSDAAHFHRLAHTLQVFRQHPQISGRHLAIGRAVIAFSDGRLAQRIWEKQNARARMHVAVVQILHRTIDSKLRPRVDAVAQERQRDLPAA